MGRSTVQSLCLYGRRLSLVVARVSPYVVHLGRRGALTQELIAKGWGASWGVFMTSSGILHDLRRHFRRLLRVRDEGGRTFLFRFYDPRVLRVYLPTCQPAELRAFFGPVERFYVEGESPETIMEFSLARRPPRGDLVLEVTEHATLPAVR